MQGKEREADKGSKLLKHTAGEEKYALKHTQKKNSLSVSHPFFSKKEEIGTL